MEGKPDSAEPVTKALVFRIGQECFGLPLDVVLEVLELASMSARVPGAPNWLAGIINHHGRVLPLIALGRLFDVDTAARALQVILVEFEGERLGLLVDQIVALEALSSDEAGRSGMRRAWHRGELVTLLAPTEILAAVDRQLVQTSGRA
ncbi:MAG: chemotaxis protein CheW [Deltaproteobacteria bacterium]|nr:chemotaxis protein CheW [Deltaproteobacteria bacterium]